MWLETQHESKTHLVNVPVRRHPRFVFSVPLSLRHRTAGGVRATRGVSLDLSEGGMGALVEGTLEVGEAVTIEMNLPAGKLDLVAMVRHTSNISLGFEFLGLSAEERKAIARVATTSEPPRSELPALAPDKPLSVWPPRTLT